ncbi:GerAB/ArcD/ProY family transporter [Clostridium sp. YIM B02505]|uniref:GerAB/ArcD/ProY family transporter n=1 Tax=Clostridium yunnanense TaxID=2800325 RepID=A0ABS1EUL2_9CLOT|nr:GerAB/ArcD/ProY family transporter [Clostridium yunnanense]MBK1813047.1 GerAB/ArcD/ProY family transporter [Clostridium yunnanense]
MKDRFYYLMLIINILCNFILYVPNKMHEELYNGVLYAIFIVLIMRFIFSYMQIYVFNTYKDLSLVEINKKLFNKVIGNIITFIYIIFNYTVGFFMYRGLVEIVNQFLLPNTHILFVSILVLAIIYVDLFNDNKSYLNFIGYLAVIVIALSLIQLPIAFREVKFFNIRGVIIHSNRLPKLSTIWTAAFFFSGVSHLTAFNPNFKKISWKKTFLVYILVGIPVALLSIYVPVGIWGPVAIQNIQFPWIATADTLQLDLFFIERVLFILLPLFFLLSASQLLNYNHVGYSLFKELFPKKIYHIIFTVFCSILYLIITIVFRNSQSLMKTGSLFNSAFFLVNIAVSAISFFIIKVRGRVKKC